MGANLGTTGALLWLLVLVAAACAAPAGAPAEGQDPRRGAAQEPAGASVADATRGDGDLVIWADEARSDALRPLADAFGDDHGVSVALQAVPFEQIRDQFQVTAPDGDGPDVIIGAHEWLGELVPSGMVTPVDLGDRAPDLAEVAVSAVTYDGRTYGVPYALSSVALVRNTRHVPTAPGTWEDLAVTARDLRERGAVSVGLAVPEDPYHLYPLVTAFGGYLFGRDTDGAYDVADLGIDSPGGLAAASRSRRWAAEGIVGFTGSGAEAQERFRAGEAAFAILDPAAVDGDDHGLAASGVPYEVSIVPPVEGRTARPFVTVEAVMVSAFAVDPELAERFLLDVAATEDGQAALASATGRPPAHRGVPVTAAGDRDASGFAASARNGVALPAVPETGSVWGPWAEALERIHGDDAEPRQALSGAADEIRDLVGG